MRQIIKYLKILYGWLAFVVFATLYMIASVIQIFIIHLLPGKVFKYNIVYWINIFIGYLLHYIISATPVRVRKCGKWKYHPPYIIVANHNNYLDVSALHIAFNRLQLRFIGKKELTKIPLWGYVYKKTHIIVDRKDPVSRKESLIRSKTLIQEGRNIVIFAEGTTRKPEDVLMLPFRDGAFILSQRTHRPIIPVAILGTRGIVDRKTLALTPRFIKIFILPPVYPEQFQTIEEYKEHVYNLILKVLKTYECPEGTNKKSK